MNCRRAKRQQIKIEKKDIKVKARVMDDAISSFIQISGVDSVENASYFLQAKNWKLDEALNLFYEHASLQASKQQVQDSANEVWESNGTGGDDSSNSSSSLASSYRPPYSLMFGGSFEQAREHASTQNKWLIANLQSDKMFDSRMLNRDTWSEKNVEETLHASFIFWQINDDDEEGRKVSTYYRVEVFPAVLVIDPITGQKKRSWSGFVHPLDLLDDLSPYTEEDPKACLFGRSQRRTSENNANVTDQDHLDEAAKSVDGHSLNLNKMPEDGILSNVSDQETVLVLPEEPQGSKEVICRVGIRFPDGRRLKRNFLRADPIELLWVFCGSQMEESESGNEFWFTLAVPGAAPKRLVKGMPGSNLTFDQAEVCDSMLSLVWL